MSATDVALLDCDITVTQTNGESETVTMARVLIPNIALAFLLDERVASFTVKIRDDSMVLADVDWDEELKGLVEPAPSIVQHEPIGTAELVAA